MESSKILRFANGWVRNVYHIYIYISGSVAKSLIPSPSPASKWLSSSPSPSFWMPWNAVAAYFLCTDWGFDLGIGIIHGNMSLPAIQLQIAARPPRNLLKSAWESRNQTARQVVGNLRFTTKNELQRCLNLAISRQDEEKTNVVEIRTSHQFHDNLRVSNASPNRVKALWRDHGGLCSLSKACKNLPGILAPKGTW